MDTVAVLKMMVILAVSALSQAAYLAVTDEEPTDEELRQNWRYNRKQERLALITNSIPYLRNQHFYFMGMQYPADRTSELDDVATLGLPVAKGRHYHYGKMQYVPSLQVQMERFAKPGYGDYHEGWIRYHPEPDNKTPGKITGSGAVHPKNKTKVKTQHKGSFDALRKHLKKEQRKERREHEHSLDHTN